MLANRLIQSVNRGINLVLTNAQDLNLYVLAGSPSGKQNVTVTIPTGVVIGQVAAVAALDTGAWASGTKITFEHHGSIMGRAGRAGTFTSPNGGNGGDAVKMNYAGLAVEFRNYGSVLAGGGGGGEGGDGGNGGHGGSGDVPTGAGRQAYLGQGVLPGTPPAPNSDVDAQTYFRSSYDAVTGDPTGGTEAYWNANLIAIGPGEITESPDGTYVRGDFFETVNFGDPSVIIKQYGVINLNAYSTPGGAPGFATGDDPGDGGTGNGYQRTGSTAGVPAGPIHPGKPGGYLAGDGGGSGAGGDGGAGGTYGQDGNPGGNGHTGQTSGFGSSGSGQTSPTAGGGGRSGGSAGRAFVTTGGGAGLNVINNGGTVAGAIA